MKPYYLPDSDMSWWEYVTISLAILIVRVGEWIRRAWRWIW